MKKRIPLILIFVFLCLTVLVVCLLSKSASKQLISFSRDELKEVTITNGTNGLVSKLGDEEIDKLYNLCYSIKGSEISQEEASGWEYYVDFYVGDNVERITFVSNEVCNISADVYAIDAKDGDKVLEMLKQVDRGAR